MTVTVTVGEVVVQVSQKPGESEENFQRRVDNLKTGLRLLRRPAEAK